MVKLLMVGLLLATSSIAEAKGIMLITHGETVKDLGEPPPDQKEAVERDFAPGAQLGYCYSYFGVFWLDLWTWAGEPCLHDGNKGVWKLDAAAGTSLGINKPFFYSYPEGLVLVLGAVAVFGLLAVWGGRINAATRKRVESDPRLRHALELLRQDPTGAKAKEYLADADAEATIASLRTAYDVPDPAQAPAAT